MTGIARAVAVCSFVVVAGCATMTPEECAVADWEHLGERDGRSGQSPEYFARRASDCAEAGYDADQAAWRRGWDRGIVDFCTPGSGFREGLEGHGYDHICPGHLEDRFLDGYEAGVAIHDAETRLDRTRSEIERAEKRLEELHEEEKPDRKAIERERDRLETLRKRRHEQELELERLRGVAEGRGFRP
ncbi:MAG: DUF2799 domain-containing protein [Wenzhouxiangella sp.]